MLNWSLKYGEYNGGKYGLNPELCALLDVGLIINFD